MGDKVLVRAERVAALAALAAGDFMGAKALLFQAVPDLTDLIVLADCVEADFTGYARSTAITWAGEYEIDGTLYEVGGSKVFSASGSTVTNQVTAWGVVNMAGTGLLYVEVLDNPVNFASALDSFVLVPKIPYGA